VNLNKLAFLAVLSSLQALTQTPAATRFHGPVRDRVDHFDGTSTSTNWSGYAVTGTSFTSAKASWIVPSVLCTGVTGNQYSSFWVGLDGYGSNTVEQTGTDSDCDGTRANYYAWYEFYPAASVLIPTIGVSAGNFMSASVSYSGNKFTVTITNQTTGKAFTTSGTVPGAARSSAEWIAEAPSSSSGILPMSDFGTIDFGYDYTRISGSDDATEPSHSGPISAFPSANVYQINKAASTASPQTSTCSTLSSDGTSFSCTWAK
jgi:hypothetical protein